MYLKFAHMTGEAVIDLTHWHNRDGECASVHYVVCALKQKFFHFLPFNGCEMQGVATA